MPNSHEHTNYSVAEERINVGSHALGLLLSIVALVLLIEKARGALQVVSVSVFASSMTALYFSSTIYHGTKSVTRRARLRTLDHAMIYVLIAGTYTPFSLLVLTGEAGWAIFGASWAMAATGIVIKFFHTGRYDKVSTAMYVLMGWIIVFAIKPLIANMPIDGLIWLFAGGIAYTVGALSYSIGKLRFGHALFHVFVLIGSTCHFISIYYYVLGTS